VPTSTPWKKASPRDASDGDSARCTTASVIFAAAFPSFLQRPRDDRGRGAP
jgi:hypothetical protein